MARNDSSNSVAIVAIFLILIIAFVAIYFMVLRHPDAPSAQTTVIESVTQPVKEIKEQTTTVVEPPASTTTSTTTVEQPASN